MATPGRKPGQRTKSPVRGALFRKTLCFTTSDLPWCQKLWELSLKKCDAPARRWSLAAVIMSLLYFWVTGKIDLKKMREEDAAQKKETAGRKTIQIEDELTAKQMIEEKD